MRVYFFALCISFSIQAASYPVKADDWADCKLSAPNARIAACSRIIEKGERKAQDLATAYRYRSSTYRQRNMKVEAIADLQEATRLDPKNAAFFRGQLDVVNDDLEAAISDYGEAIKSKPGDADIYNARGFAYERKGDLDRAMADYSKAIQLDPKQTQALTNRGNVHRKKGELQQALADLGEATRLQPGYPSPYLVRGFLFEKENDLDRAVTELDHAIQFDAKYADAYAERAYIYIRKSDTGRAIHDANTAIKLDPQSFAGYNSRGLAYAAQGELDKALTDYDRAIQLNSKVSYVYSNRANTYAAKNLLDRAIADYSLAIEADSKDPRGYYHRGKFYEKKKNADRALSDYRKVLDLPAFSNVDRQRQELTRQRIARLTQPGRDPTKSPSPETLPAKRVALVIGNAKYANVGELTNPRNDAKGVAASLRRLGFAKVMELYDLGREQMGRALNEFGDLAENAEWAVVFYAGHGLEMNGVSYLIPTDAALLRDTHVTEETISLTQVQAKVDAAPKLGLVILDSCRNNPFLARMVRSGGTARAIGRGLANVDPEGSVLVAYSAKHGTTASDGDGADSPFTEALLSHIEEPGLEINFLFRKVRDDVRTKTQRRQEPYLYGSLSSEPLYFKEAVRK
jgi:tetratricopeptide (TPR) repeat protein